MRASPSGSAGPDCEQELYCMPVFSILDLLEGAYSDRP